MNRIRIAILLSVLIVIVITVIQMLFPVKLIQTTKNGFHTGIVTAVETNGIIFKTNRVYFKTNDESTQEDTYCVIGRQLKEELINKQRSKEIVTLHYDDYLFVGYSLCKGEPIITGVE